MLRKFLKSRAAPARSAAAIPVGQRVYAIGDIHGRLDLLDTLLAAIDADDGAREDATTSLIFLGDFVDRGADSAGVVERVRQLVDERANVRWLIGNHEEIFLAAIDGDQQALRLFCRVGGRETAISYGIAAGDYEAMDYAELGDALAAVVPAAHRTFLSSGEDIVIVGGYAFVHAGVHPDRALDQQRTADLRWIRERFLDHPRPLEKMIVHGHTIADTVEFAPHRIGIDTGAYASGKLTALGLEGEQVWQVATG
jgi:serine/threonine protein phosphatase 1